MHDDQPLGLTVHAMPAMSDVGVTARRTRAGRWKMILVFVMCAAPVVASYLAYYVVRPEGRQVFGTLINPQRPLPDVVGTAVDGSAVNLRALKGQWLLMSVGGGACDADCQNYLYMERQLRESLGKEKDRVDRVWLIDDNAPIPAALASALEGATVLRVPTIALNQWLQADKGHAVSEHLYLVDPLGNWMMRFPAKLDMAGAAKAKRDLDRLLRASASWDTEGR
ncbi:MAG: hypothetical protein ABIR55_21830 [Burkholderiaceae bacterium]